MRARCGCKGSSCAECMATRGGGLSFEVRVEGDMFDTGLNQSSRSGDKS